MSRSTIPGNFLNDGPYFLSVGSDTPMMQSHFRIDPELAFRVEHTRGGNLSDTRLGIVCVALRWEIQKLA